jgi:hypothetical protein
VGGALLASAVALLGIDRGRGHTAPAAVEPLGEGGSEVPLLEPTGHEDDPAQDQSEPPSANSAPPSPTRPATAPDPWAELDALLARYDVALGSLSGDPAAAADPVHPLTLQWHDVVATGTELDESLRRRILDDLAERSIVVVPGPEGVAFVTRALGARSGPDGAIEFEHCGYSPGVGVHATTGEVLDDRRTSTRGSGRVERGADGRLLLVALVDEQHRLLGPGEVDPCPILQTAARSGGA